jgi:RNA polymerase sigma-70 factor, ECF subfamily
VAEGLAASEVILPKTEQTVLDVGMTEGCMAIPTDCVVPRVEASRNVDELYSYAKVLTLNAAEAEELVEQTYVRTLAGLESQAADHNIKTWQFTTLRNVWLQRSRSGCAGPAVGGKDSSPDTVVRTLRDSLIFYPSETEHERVRKAIEHLPLEFREIILLREYEDLSHQEIAGIVGCGTEMVVSRIARARSHLRTLLFTAAKGTE